MIVHTVGSREAQIGLPTTQYLIWKSKIFTENDIIVDIAVQFNRKLKISPVYSLDTVRLLKLRRVLLFLSFFLADLKFEQ